MPYNSNATEPSIEDLKKKARQAHMMCDPDQELAFEIVKKSEKGIENLVSFLIEELNMSYAHVIPQIRNQYNKILARRTPRQQPSLRAATA
jgi:hypothetical protein